MPVAMGQDRACMSGLWGTSSGANVAQADLDTWEPRYASGGVSDSPPDPWITTVAAAFLPDHGTAVDLAGGAGRHARWLAGRGLESTVVDIAPSGLRLARERAAAEGLALHTLVWDLDHGLPEGAWDVVLIRFFLVRPLLEQLHRVVAPGGVLIHLHPTHRNLERHARPSARWLLEDGELGGVPGLETLHLEEGWGREGRHEVRYVGRRRS